MGEESHSLISPLNPSFFVCERTAPLIEPLHCREVNANKSVKNVIGSMSCLLVDTRNHDLVDSLLDRTQSHLRAYYQHDSLKERQKIRTIRVDM